MLVEVSKNKKLGNIAATYAPIEQTCPKTCKLKKLKICYAGLGYVGIHNKRLEKQLKDKRPRDIARLEAKEIDNAFKGEKVPNKKPLRLHVSGDCRTNEAAKIIGKAATRYKNRGGGSVFTYTHAWKDVDRSSWGEDVSVLASVDSVLEANEAQNKGYAPTIVVSEFRKEKAHILWGSKIKWIPCPEQTRGTSCTDCRLCMDANRLHNKGMGILFKAHGSNKKKLKVL